MASLLYHWNFTGNDDLSLNEAIYDSESNLVAKVKRRVSGESGGTYSNSDFSVDENGIELNNNDSTNGGYYIDLEGLDTENVGGSIAIEMVFKNIERTDSNGNNKDTVYFQSIREFIDEDESGDPGHTYDDNIGTNQPEGGIVTSGFNSHSAFLKLFYKGGTGTRMQVRTDSQYDSTAKDGRVTYFLRNATSGQLNDNDFHHYLIIIDKNGTNNSKTIQLFIDGIEANNSTANLQKELSDAVRQYNAIGTQKNPVNATYLKGTVKYLKIYQGPMTDNEATSIYNNYNDSPYYSDYSGASDSDKYTRRHTSVSDYFTNNPSISSFSMTGNQLGLLNPSETYTIHKFTNGGSIDISSGYNYVPLSGQNNHIIFKNDTTWYKITQTSADNGTSTIYKYEISTDSGSNYGDAVTGKTFGDNFTSGDITICFGGAESGAEDTICFHEDTQIQTDQGEVLIKNLTSKHTINGAKIIYLIKSPSKAKQLVLIEKNAFGINKPSRDMLLTKSHTIIINNKKHLVYHLINNTTIRLVDNRIKKADVYNLFLLNKEYITINNLDFGIINITNEQLNILNCYVNKNIKQVNFGIHSKHKNLKTNKSVLSIQDYKNFNNI